MTTPDPIEGWSFHASGLPGSLQWEVRSNDIGYGRAWFDEQGFNVASYFSDSYEAATSYTVPLAVVDALRKLQHAETPMKVPLP